MDIVVGRTIDDLGKYGLEATVYIGKEYIKMENDIVLANNVYLDVNFPHLILIAGKRGQGKSYTLASIAESIGLLKKEYRENISVLIFDTMGIFWTMKFPNYKEAELLEKWGLKPRSLENVRVLIPKGLADKYRELDIPFDEEFTLNPYDLSGIEWTMVFGLNPTDNIAIYIRKIISEMKKNNNGYSIGDIINYIEKKQSIDPNIKTALINYFMDADDWGLFSEKAPPIRKLTKPGYINILDISLYTAITGGWSVKNLVIGLVSKKIFYERLLYRKREELEEAYIGYKMDKREMPLVWLMIDEAHESIGLEPTPATEPLIQIIREGRQPGLSLILATQQPGKMHTDVITQADIVISHRVTAQRDLNALNEIMRNFTAQDIEIYMNENLPKRKGAALILDDKSERIYPVQMKPRFTWHGGEDPKVIRKRLWLGQ